MNKMYIKHLAKCKICMKFITFPVSCTYLPTYLPTYLYYLPILPTYTTYLSTLPTYLSTLPTYLYYLPSLPICNFLVIFKRVNCKIRTFNLQVGPHTGSSLTFAFRPVTLGLSPTHNIYLCFYNFLNRN